MVKVPLSSPILAPHGTQASPHLLSPPTKSVSRLVLHAIAAQKLFSLTHLTPRLLISGLRVFFLPNVSARLLPRSSKADAEMKMGINWV